MEISIIIPTYNEASCIDSTLLNLFRLKSKGNLVKEIIVVDAHSTDKTQDIVKKHTQVTLLESGKGRPIQMNVGANQARGSILYFLHADSTPPQDFDIHIVNAIKAKHLAGCFRMRFDSQHFWMKGISWLTKFNYKICRGGDQSLFVSKPLFEEIGGFDESYLIFEDHEILAKLYRKTKFKVIQKTLITSARRFQDKGLWRLQFLFLTMYLKKYSGASPEALYKFYKKHIE